MEGKERDLPGLSRRDFIKGAVAASLVVIGLGEAVRKRPAKGEETNNKETVFLPIVVRSEELVPTLVEGTKYTYALEAIPVDYKSSRDPTIRMKVICGDSLLYIHDLCLPKALWTGIANSGVANYFERGRVVGSVPAVWGGTLSSPENQAAYQEAVEAPPDIAIFAVGTNLCKNRVWEREGAAFFPTLEEQIRTLIERNPEIKVALVIPPSPSEAVRPAVLNRWKEIAAGMGELALKIDPSGFNLKAIFPREEGYPHEDDMYHLTQEGTKLFAQDILEQMSAGWGYR